MTASRRDRDPRGTPEGRPSADDAGGGRVTGSRTRGGPADGSRPEEEIYHCDLCGSVMLNLHCKLICRQCGYKRDCSDP